MLKHQFTPARSRKGSGTVASGSLDTSVTDSIDSNIEEEQENTARMVWDSHTNPGSELSMAKRRLAERELQSKSKVVDTNVSNTGIKKLEEAAPKHLVKINNVEKEPVYQDMSEVPAFTNLKRRALLSNSNQNVLGLDTNQLMMVVAVILVSLILYSVLLLLTVRAAQCQDTLETIMEQRREWQRKVMEGMNRGKSGN